MNGPRHQQDPNRQLEHRGVRFSIQRVSWYDADPEYLWTIYPSSGPADGARSGRTEGQRAFLRAYKEAQALIDEWLVGRPGDAAASSNDAPAGDSSA
jgi:hypothetical protein